MLFIHKDETHLIFIEIDYAFVLQSSNNNKTYVKVLKIKLKYVSLTFTRVMTKSLKISHLSNLKILTNNLIFTLI